MAKTSQESMIFCFRNLYIPYPWLEMVRFNASYFISLVSSMKKTAEIVKSIRNNDENLPNDFRDSVVKELVELAVICNKASLIFSSKHIERVGNQIGGALTGAELYAIWHSIPDVITTEAKQRQVFIISQEDAEHFENKFPFGDEVHAHFPSASYDIKEAGKCLALNRNTACVMHLMRAVEVGLSVLSQNLHIPYKRKSWEQIINKIPKKIDEIEKKTRKPPKWPELRQFYSETSEQFRLLRDAYRNEAMHFNQTYGREQAKDIYVYTKAFMGTLAKRLREKKIV